MVVDGRCRPPLSRHHGCAFKAIRSRRPGARRRCWSSPDSRRALAGVYAGRRPGFDWLLRVMAGVVAGTASRVWDWPDAGFTGVSAVPSSPTPCSCRSPPPPGGVWVLKTRALSGSALDVDNELRIGLRR